MTEPMARRCAFQHGRITRIDPGAIWSADTIVRASRLKKPEICRNLTRQGRSTLAWADQAIPRHQVPALSSRMIESNRQLQILPGLDQFGIGDAEHASPKNTIAADDTSVSHFVSNTRTTANNSRETTAHDSILLHRLILLDLEARSPRRNTQTRHSDPRSLRRDRSPTATASPGSTAWRTASPISGTSPLQDQRRGEDRADRRNQHGP